MGDVKQVLIFPLKGPNYATWKMQCMMALKKEGVWRIVSGTEAPPAEDAAADTREQYVGRRDKALATIVLSVDPSLLYLLGNPVDPVAVWRKLEEQFQKKSWVNRLNLRRKLHSLILKDGDSVQEHVKTMLETFNQLSIVGDTITDEDRVVYLLASLPKSFSTLVTALESNPVVPDMEIVIERLMHEERKFKNYGVSSESESDGALADKHKVASKGPRCFECHRFGHIQRYCPERIRYLAEPRSFEYRKSNRQWNKGKRNEVHQTRDKWESESDSERNITGLVMSHALSTVECSETDSWIIDSGATSHICNDRRSFTDFHTLEKPQYVTLGDGHALSAIGTGNVYLELVLKNGKTGGCKLHNVLYVPELTFNLLSVSKAAEAGKRILFHSTDCQIVDWKDMVVALGDKKGNLYYLSCQKAKVKIHVSDARLNDKSKEFIWHQRFGHLNERSLRTLASMQLVYGLDYNASKQLPFCESCMGGKLYKIPFSSKGRNQAVVHLGLVHSDVCGPMSTESLSGARYLLTFVDDKTHYTWVYVLKSKSEVFSKFLEWKA